MGRFSHEAVGIDPRTSIAYLTEDDGARGSFLYRHVPHDRRRRPGALGAGGRLDALALDDGPGRAVRWVPVRPERANEDALARGAHRFERLEGATFAGGAFWFDDTAGGAGGRGRVYRLVPGPDGDVLERFLDAGDSGLKSPDNVVVTPFGDLWFAEDGGGDNRVMGVTPDGGVYEFARNRITDSEFAGPCFSPDGGRSSSTSRTGAHAGDLGPLPRLRARPAGARWRARRRRPRSACRRRPARVHSRFTDDSPAGHTGRAASGETAVGRCSDAAPHRRQGCRPGPPPPPALVCLAAGRPTAW